MKELTDKFEEVLGILLLSARKQLPSNLLMFPNPNQDRAKYTDFERSLDDWVGEQMKDGLDVWSDWVDKVGL